MLTLRQIEKWWNAKSYSRLIDELCAGRAEGVNGIRDLIDGPIAAAALTIIRADELRQSAHPHVGKMVQLLLTRQDRLGGWGDAVTTAIAARSLAIGITASQTAPGTAVDDAVTRLADLQSEDGEWTATIPAMGGWDCAPGRGLSCDADVNPRLNGSDHRADAGLADMAVTAFVLYQLATIRRPAAALLIDGALNQMLAPAAGDRQLDTLRRRIEARRVLAPAA